MPPANRISARTRLHAARRALSPARWAGLAAVINSPVMPPTRLELHMRDGAHPGEKVMVLEGVLNAETTFRFRDAVRQHEAPTLVVDMSEVRSVDSSGLGVLIGAYVSCERNCRRLLLVGVNDRIWDLFRTCKVEDVFTRYPTLAAAEQAVTG